METHVAPSPISADTAVADAGAPVRVQIRGLNKSFGPAHVLRNVDLDVRAGEIHALVGQNGSGKSTLIKILSGMYSADQAGRVTIDGNRLSNPVRPPELRAHGLAFVHQDLGLVDECNVVENLRLGQFSRRRFSRRIKWAAERGVAADTLARLHSDIAGTRLVSSLSPAEKGVVAVGRALQSIVPGSGCIVFDESTRAIPREVLPDFYRIIRDIADAGTAIIIVSHRLDEVLNLAQRVTVLRDGAVVAHSVATADLTEATLAHLMLGRELESLIESNAPEPSTSAAGRREDVTGRISARARRLSLGQLKELDLDVSTGEVIGITGPTNSGYADVPSAMTGSSPAATGTIEVRGHRHRLPLRSPRPLIDAGIVMAPEDRADAGLALDQPAQHNLTLPRARKHGRLLLTAGWQSAEFAQATTLLSIAPPDPQLNCAAFSGGNQQKIMVAKWLLNNPEVLVLHEPTQAVDVAARRDILQAIRAAAARGVAVVIVSCEAQDLAAACDRVIVIRDGVQASELTGPLTPQAITAATYATAETSAAMRRA